MVFKPGRGIRARHVMQSPAPTRRPTSQVSRRPPAPARCAPQPMDLLEYQGKQLFAKHGVAVPSGEVAANVEDAVAAAGRIGYPCAIKGQVLIGGRGQAGGSKVRK